MQTASLIVYVYAVLVAVGGLTGYLKAKSLPSLVMGFVSGLALAAAGYAIGSHAVWGLPLAVALTLFLLVFFSLRYIKSSPRAFMPGGLMAVVSLLTLAAIFLTKK